LDIVQKTWAPHGKVFAPPGVPSWLRAWLCLWWIFWAACVSCSR